MEDPTSSAATGSPRARQGDHDGVLCDQVSDEELCSKAAAHFLRASGSDPFQDGEEDDAVYGREFLLPKKADEWARGDALANLVFELRADDELFGGAERLLCVRDLFETGKEEDAKEPSEEPPPAAAFSSGKA
ncbi:hypothetical protein HPB50_022110 [Hyalomma asiaticum]|uniref:Uncharacterized protein n=1 Tax=Hyalomma asiaticum TaxID=266040 RepID=A0ACB7TSR2_HYAAI|nr:hypothetical protein HPB50_022110 [Hyalomma asiaticum]